MDGQQTRFADIFIVRYFESRVYSNCVDAH